jgi:hypothetical protein
MRGPNSRGPSLWSRNAPMSGGVNPLTVLIEANECRNFLSPWSECAIDQAGQREENRRMKGYGIAPRSNYESTISFQVTRLLSCFHGTD